MFKQFPTIHKLPKKLLKKIWKKKHNFQIFALMMSSLDATVALETNY